MLISIIVAMDEHGVIGVNGALPWRLSADLKHVKETTLGKPVLMGRKTHESIGRPLPGRENIVITRDAHFQSRGCTIFHDIDTALDYCKDQDEIVIMGGAQLYRQTLPRADRIYLTEVHASVRGDTWFPEFNRTQWREMFREDHDADKKNEYPYSFVLLERELIH